MFGLGIARKEIFLAYSTQFVFSTIRVVPGKVVMVAIDMCGKSRITGEWIYGITWKHAYFNIFVLFIVDTTSILKLMCPTVYCFYLDGYFGGCVAVIIVTVVVVFNYLFICLFIYLFIYLFVDWLICLFNLIFSVFYAFIYLLFFLPLRLLFLFLLSLLSLLLLLLLLESLLPFVCDWLLLLLTQCLCFQSWFYCLRHILL